VNRLHGAAGVCRIGRQARVASAFLHHGEEPMIRGSRGSGTVFLAGCSLHCCFCQNWETSHLDEGEDVGPSALAAVLGHLARQGAHNWNFVTPTHVTAQLLEALGCYLEQQPHGPALPIVWNTGGYETIETLRLLDGIVDIYMPDLKFMDPAAAGLTMEAPDYPDAATAALREMVRQTGPVRFDSAGVLCRGTLVRHLVMPGHLDDTERILRHLAAAYGRDIAVNVMGQYHPCGEAHRDPRLTRPLSYQELADAQALARELDLRLA
jgi:putative pyruvate formate lyase activating enzyme